jgi:CubicO group peptidase (beta-lactamase class C family)
MRVDIEQLNGTLDALGEPDPLSGVISLHHNGELVLGRTFGMANRSDSIPNTLETRFQVASGCKIFTSVAICQLIQRGVLAPDTKLDACLSYTFPYFDPGITIHHLLTHTSGMPDYFDEEGGEDFEALWKERPSYTMTRPRDFLSMFQNEKMMFKPGERFSYNGAGFILMGLIIEEHTQLAFSDYIKKSVFEPAGMVDSGYFSADHLPDRTAQAYIEDENGNWRSNIYSVPIVGGPDGGAYVTSPDMASFWSALYTHELLNEKITEVLLQPHVDAETQRWPTQYGYGVWITRDTRGARINCVEGWDPGVAFLSATYPGTGVVITIALNHNRSVWKIFEEIAPLLDLE